MADEEKDSSFDRAFSAIWETGTSVGTMILEQRAAQELADQAAKNQLQQQALYAQLSQQSSNLGPNNTPASINASRLQTGIMQGPQAVANALGFPGYFVWYALLALTGGVIIWAILRRR